MLAVGTGAQVERIMVGLNAAMAAVKMDEAAFIVGVQPRAAERAGMGWTVTDGSDRPRGRVQISAGLRTSPTVSATAVPALAAPARRMLPHETLREDMVLISRDDSIDVNRGKYPPGTELYTVQRIFKHPVQGEMVTLVRGKSTVVRSMADLRERCFQTEEERKAGREPAWLVPAS
jgi:hypothetical protein